MCIISLSGESQWNDMVARTMPAWVSSVIPVVLNNSGDGGAVEPRGGGGQSQRGGRMKIEWGHSMDTFCSPQVHNL